MKPLISQLPSKLRRQAVALDKLNQALSTALPAEMHGHVQVASVQRNTLVLEADSPAWAAKVRYLGNDFARRIAKNTGLTLTSVKLSIRPAASPPSRLRRTKPRLSGRAAEQFRSLAATENHSALKQALLRLSRHRTSGGGR